MWVETEDGRLVNLDAMAAIKVEGVSRTVVAWEAGLRDVRYLLCYCDDEDHGKQILGSLVELIHDGDRVANMRLLADENREVVS